MARTIRPVPRYKTATQKVAGEAEYSASWVGIGGGCVDAACSIGDGTLIQAGIGHDIDATGAVDYYAWWETIPAPLVRTTLRVGPGDRVAVAIFEGRVPELWTIVAALPAESTGRSRPALVRASARAASAAAPGRSRGSSR